MRTMLKKSNKYLPLEKKEIELSDLSKLEEGKVDAPKRSLSFVELMWILLPYFWPDKGTDGAFINRVRSTSTWFMVIASKTCNLCAPFYIAKAANDLMAGEFTPACQALILYSALRLASSTFKELQTIMYIKVKQQASIELQEFTFTHLHNLSLNWHLSKKTGIVIKSMDRGVDAANSLVSYLFLFLVPAIAECLAVAILFFVRYKQWQLGAVVVVGVTLYSITTIIITEWRKKFREQTNKHDNDYHGKATDSIINYETVKYFTGEIYEIKRFKESVAKYQQYSSSTQLSLSLLNISQQVILNATMLATMIIAGRAVVQGDMNIGGWIAVQSWVTSIFAPLNFLGSVYGAIFQAWVDIRNLSELLFESPDIIDSADAVDIPIYSNRINTNNISNNKYNNNKKKSVKTDSTGSFTLEDEEDDYEDNDSMKTMITTSSSHSNSSSRGSGRGSGASLEFRGVYFHYPTQPAEKGLKDVNIMVKPGTTTAVVGHTGAGKTTISRLLFRFYDPLHGSVLLDGMDIKNYTQKSVRRAIGIVPQDTVLFNDTILHNIHYGRLDASIEDVMAAAEAAQIRNFIESLPEKWETMVGERGMKLSGGEKQRVAIARCLLKNPPIVLLDEATSALDTITENSIQEALITLGQNRTVVIIAHRLSTIKHADQIVVMDAGIVKEVGSHEQLLAIEDSIYSQMWNMQTTSTPAMLLHGNINSNNNSPISTITNNNIDSPTPMH